MLVICCQQEVFLQVRSAWKMRQPEMCIHSLCCRTKTNPPWHQFMGGWICIKPKWSRDCSSLFFSFCSSFCFAWTKQPWNTMQILTHLKCSIKITMSERLGVFFFFCKQEILRHDVCLPEADKKPESLKNQVGISVDFILLLCLSTAVIKLFLFGIP